MLSDAQRVVVTGMGAVTPIGNNVDTFWHNLLANECGTDTIKAFDPTGLPSQVAAEVKGFKPRRYRRLAKRNVLRLPRATRLALAAVDETTRQAKFPWRLRRDTGILFGCDLPGLGVIRTAILTEAEGNLGHVSPAATIMVMPNTVAASISISQSLMGCAVAPVAACATGVYSIGLAYNLIRSGQMPVAIAGGTESGMQRVAFASLGNLRALSTHYNDQPQKASRPFDKDRCGFVFGEGAGALVLMSLEEAKRHGIEILAEIIGFGTSADARGMMDPTGYGAALAMRRALASAGVSPRGVHYINAHATSTVKGDEAETRAIRAVFGRRADQIPVSSIKGQTGHTLGGSGAIEMIAAIQAIRTGVVPGTFNCDQPGLGCNLDYMTDGPRRINPRVVMKNAFGFGGANGVLVIRSFED